MPFWQRKQLDIQSYNQHFSNHSASVKIGPLDNRYRSCTDICCLVVFGVISVAGLVIGAIMINDGRKFNNEIIYHNNTIINITELTVVFQNYSGIIIGMFAFSLFLSIIFIFLIYKFPRCMIYTMIIFIFLIYITLIILGAISGILWMVVTFSLMLVINAILLWCFWSRITTGIMLLQLTTSLITQKPSIYLSSLYPLLFGLIFFIYWLYAMIGQLHYLDYLQYQKRSNPTISTQKSNAFISIWIVYFIFMVQFLYYVQTYLIATCCANWYYRIRNNYLIAGAITMNRYHLGSITFAAIVITFLNILKRIAREQSQRQASNGHGCLSLFTCIIACCLSCIQDLVKTLNHNAIIVMSITGENYIDSAKTALAIILSNFGLFYVVEFIAELVTMFGMVVSVGIPTITGFLIVRYSKQGDSTMENYTAITIFFLSFLLSGIVISMIGQILSCIFILFCFDQKFRSIGITIPNSPIAIQSFLHYQNTGQELYTIRPLRIGTQEQLRRNL